jgi:hypothetical protein
VHSIRFAYIARAALAVALVPFTLVSCGGHSNIARADQCRQQIVLSLAPGVGRTDREMDRLADDTEVSLEYLRSTSPTLFVYSLSARGRDPGCQGALSRLRQDSHVRFAESDARRTVHGLGE